MIRILHIVPGSARSLAAICLLAATTLVGAQGIVLRVDQVYSVKYYQHGDLPTDTLKGVGFNVEADAPLEMSMPRPHGGPVIAIADGDSLFIPPAGAVDTGCYNPGPPVSWACPEGVRSIWVTAHDSVSNAFLRFTPFNEDSSTIHGPFRFYVPKIIFLDSNGNPFVGQIELQADQPIRVRVQMLDYRDSICRDCGDIKVAINALPGSENLVFRSSWGLANLDSIVLDNGEGTFLLGAEAPVTAGGFEVTGYPHPTTGDARMVGTFPIPIEISFPDAASLDSAAVYDTDGDGLADSVVGWFDRDLSGVLPESLFTNWPNEGAFAAITGSIRLSGATIGSDISEVLPDSTNSSGALRAVVLSESGRMVPSTAALVDHIGPVLRSVTILEGVGDAPDTLIAIFNKPIDSTFTDGEAFLVNGERVNVAGDMEGDLQWRFEVQDGLLDEGDSIRIVPAGPLAAQDGNLAATNNRPVAIGNSGRLPPLTDDGNGFFDTDGNGILDSVAVEFLTPLTREQVDSLELHFIWLGADGSPVDLQPESVDLVWDPANPTKVGWTVVAGPEGIRAGLTSIDAPSYGYGVLVGSYVVNGDTLGDTASIAMADRMAPVLVDAFLWPESSRSDRGDSLLLTFSESLDSTAVNNIDFLSFLLNGETVTSFDVASLALADSGRQLGLRLAEGTELTDRPNPGDSVRAAVVVSGGISDSHGNQVSVEGSWVLIRGEPRMTILYPTIAFVDRDDIPGSTGKGAVSAEYLPADAAVRDLPFGTMGHLLDVGFATRIDSIGDVDLHEVGMSWSIHYFTNLGGYVAGSDGEVRCDDPGFSVSGTGPGNCFEHPRKIYLRWNLRAENGRKVGTGAYVAKVAIKVWGTSNNLDVQELYTLGVRGMERARGSN